MANSFNDYSKCWVLNTDDILTNTPVCISKIVLYATTDGGKAEFHSLDKELATPVLDLTNDTFTVNISSDTDKILDDSGTALDDSLIAVADWAYIYDTETGLNDGWWYIKTTDSGDTFIEVVIDDNAQGSHALSSDASKNYNIKVYNSEVAAVVISDKIGNTGSLSHAELNWEPKGRWFNNLAMNGLTNAVAYVYIK